MALVKCPECGHQVSDKASACPNCGCPLLCEAQQNKSINSIPPLNHAWVDKWYRKKKKYVIACCVLAPFTFFCSLAFLIQSHVAERKRNGYTVLAYSGFAGFVVIEGKIIKKIYSPKTVYGELPDGTGVTVSFNVWNGAPEIFFDSGNSNVSQQIIINNVENNTTVVKNGKQPERSDMEKILIKNAKIDALASIDPTNTEKAKKQIDIVNKLDDLG